MAIADDRLVDIVPISGIIAGGHLSQPYEAVQHHVRWRERRGEPGVAAVCDGCPGWSTGLLDGHDLEAMARLETMHTGIKVTIVRENDHRSADA